MINPKCLYSIGDHKRRLDGVAVLFGQFIKELEDKEIPHENESARSPEEAPKESECKN